VTADPRFFANPFGEVTLQRYPARRDEQLRAWCSADLLLLQALQQLGLPAEQTLLINDEYGALTVPFGPQALWTDSWLAATAAQRNLTANQRKDVPIIWSTSEPCGEQLVCVAMRVPKQLPYFEYQLSVLSRILPLGTTVFAAGMDKHLSPRTAELMERYLGPTQRHPGQRKARIFQTQFAQQTSPKFVTQTRYHCAVLGAELSAMPNVFSRDRLDIGTRFLLQHLEKLTPVERVLDLACGNGVLGLAAYQLGLGKQIILCDESAMALQSAQINTSSLFPDAQQDFQFVHGDGLLDYKLDPAQLILCNPPFHAQHTVDEYVGQRLLQQCAGHLSDGGSLCLVANRHLDYAPTLRRGFGRVEKLASNDKFILWLAHCPTPR
jgi:16S rRNA G1207 methylase RsmC